MPIEDTSTGGRKEQKTRTIQPLDADWYWGDISKYVYRPMYACMYVHCAIKKQKVTNAPHYQQTNESLAVS